MTVTKHQAAPSQGTEISAGSAAGHTGFLLAPTGVSVPLVRRKVRHVLKRWSAASNDDVHSTDTIAASGSAHTPVSDLEKGSLGLVPVEALAKPGYWQ